MIDKKVLQQLSSNNNATVNRQQVKLITILLVVSMKSRNRDVTHLELSSPWHRPLHGSVPSLFGVLSCRFASDRKTLESIISPRVQSTLTLIFDWPGGSRVIKRWWRTTLRVIAPSATPIYLLSTVCCRPDNIFISFAKQSCRCARHQTSHCAAHRGWTISVAASWRSDIGGEWRVARSCDWGGGHSDERHQSIDSYPYSCHVSVSKQLQRMTVI